MNYEIVNLEEMILVGLNERTGMNDKDCQAKIGGLWQRAYSENGIMSSVKNRANEYAYGLYSDYSEDEYDVTVGAVVKKNDNPDLCEKIIPKGRYAKFSVHGNVVTAVSKAWSDIWSMNLDRSFTGDFEEYISNDMDNSNINIYIALK